MQQWRQFSSPLLSILFSYLCIIPRVYTPFPRGPNTCWTEWTDSAIITAVSRNVLGTHPCFINSHGSRIGKREGGIVRIAMPGYWIDLTVLYPLALSANAAPVSLILFFYIKMIIIHNWSHCAMGMHEIWNKFFIDRTRAESYYFSRSY